MFPSMARQTSLGALIPPKIATPGAVSSGSTSARTANVIEFYSRLPKGALPASARRGFKAKYFEGTNGRMVGYTVGGLFLVGYSMTYYLHLRHEKNGHH